MDQKIVKISDKFPLGLAYHEIIRDEKGAPKDYRFLYVNSAFEKLTGLKQKKVLGRTVLEVTPEISESDFDWISAYGEVAETGKSVTLKEYSEPQNRWYDVTAFSDREGYFSTVFKDITEDVLEKKALEEIVNLSELCLHNDHETLDYKKVGTAVRKISRGSRVQFHLYREAQRDFTQVAIAGKKSIKGMEAAEGDVFVQKIEKSGMVFGKLTIRMKPGEPLRNEEYIRILTGILAQYFDRQQIHNTLKKEKEQMFLLFNHLEAPIYVVDMETYEILYMNKAGKEDFGEIHGETCWDVMHPGQSEACSFCPMPELKEADTPLLKKREEYYHKEKKIWYQRTDTVIDWPDGRRVKLTVAFDVTDRKEVQKQEQYLRTVMTNAHDSIIVTDEHFAITYVNKKTEELFGYPVKELLEEKVGMIYPERQLKIVQETIFPILKSGKKYTGELLTKRKDGSTFYCEISVSPVNGKHGRINGYIGIQRDISEKKEREKEVEYLSYHDHLTGFYNRRYMDDAFQRFDHKENYPIAILTVDVNGLKLTNDAYGHDVGDQLLKAVGSVLKKACRETDIISRIGGDEFVVLLPQTTEEQVEIINKRIKSLAEQINLDSVIVSLAMGFAVKNGEEQSLWEVLKIADNRMYKNKVKHGKVMRSKTIETVLRSINLKYDKEQIHTERVSLYCEAISKALGFPDNEIERIKTMGVLHDIGKITISPDILNKKTKLTENEWNQVKQHPVTGYNILKNVEEYQTFAYAVLHHHERWDGSGYPAGLKGNKIPYYGRILSVVDAYEAMTAERAYQKAKTDEEAIAELRRCAGTQFDPEIVDVFVKKVLKK